MADAKITDLDAVVTHDDSDLIEIVQSVSTTPTNKKTTWTSIKSFLKTFFDGIYINKFNGACQIPTITDNGNGTVTLGSGTYCLPSNADGSGVIQNYTIAGNTYSLTDGVNNYIVANYNAGTPIIQVITDVTAINETTIVQIFSIFRNGTTLHTQNWDALGLALANKVHQSIVKTQRYRRESGLVTTESGTRNLNLTSGRVWTGAVPITLDAIATATDNLRLWYHSGGVWTESLVTQYNNTQYDNGTNLVNLSGAGTQYAVNWIFRGVESQKHLYVVLGQGNYNLAQAQASKVPPIPTIISSHAVLVAKLIVAETANTATSIQSAFDTQFSLSTVQVHGDLSGRDVIDSHPAGAISYDNTTSGLTADDVKEAIDELSSEKAPLSSPTFTGTVTLPKTLEIQDTSADHQYVLAVNELTADRTVTLPLLTGNDEFVFKDHTQTLTNKRITARVTAITSHATPTINTDNCDAVDITALAEDITNMSTNLSGTPTNKQKLLFEIKDNGTARAISWGTSFVAGGVALPTTTVLSKILTVGFIYSTANSLNKWRCIAVAQEA